MDAFRDVFVQLTEASILLIDMLALLIVLFGTIEAFCTAAQTAISRRRSAYQQIWLRYAHWLVAALTFQLGADIIETALAPDWQDIARLAAIAVIRTFLNYFLGRDLAEVGEEARVEVASEDTAKKAKA